MDGHVHIHPCFAYGRLFDAAVANFESAARALGHRGPVVGVLMLTESVGVDAFADLASRAGTEAAPGWTVAPTAEPVSLALTRDGHRRVYVVSGRQIVVAERLEVLALATRERFPDGRPLADTVSAVRAAGAVPVVPWGFGKWSGSRGRLLAEFLHEPAGRDVLLGDNGGRLALGPTPPLLAMARRRGIPVVPGSDPLPFRSQSERAGRYGFVLTAGGNPDLPARTVVQYLQSRKDQPCPYGRLTSLPAFVISQSRMQWQARFRRS